MLAPYLTFSGGVDANGLPNGEGRGVLSNGCVHEGRFVSGCMYGEGRLTWPNGTHYEGGVLGGTLTGKGKLVWPNGDIYDGDFLDGCRHGRGTHHYSALGFIYEGEWVRGQRHGVGTLYFNADRSSFYSGDWRRGRRRGSGKIRFPNGDVYDGEWCDDLPHGRGVMTWNGLGQQYDGEWDQGVQQGLGTHVWRSIRVGPFDQPNRYHGQFFNNQRHGRGQFLYADGSSYTGEWEGDLKHGQGQFSHPDGVFFQAVFEHDRPHLQISEPHDPGDGEENGSASATEPTILERRIPSGRAYVLQYISVGRILDRSRVQPHLRNDVELVIVDTLSRDLCSLERAYRRYCRIGHPTGLDMVDALDLLQFSRFLKDYRVDQSLALETLLSERFLSRYEHSLNRLYFKDFLDGLVTVLLSNEQLIQVSDYERTLDGLMDAILQRSGQELVGGRLFNLEGLYTAVRPTFFNKTGLYVRPRGLSSVGSSPTCRSLLLAMRRQRIVPGLLTSTEAVANLLGRVPSLDLDHPDLTTPISALEIVEVLLECCKTTSSTHVDILDSELDKTVQEDYVSNFVSLLENTLPFIGY